MSPLTRGRGLKPSNIKFHLDFRVSPLTRGRGLKLVDMYSRRVHPASPLTRGRGLKQIYKLVIRCYCEVAPHAGAWIETDIARHRCGSAEVAPHAGAWIETTINALGYG